MLITHFEERVFLLDTNLMFLTCKCTDILVFNKHPLNPTIIISNNIDYDSYLVLGIKSLLCMILQFTNKVV